MRERRATMNATAEALRKQAEEIEHAEYMAERMATADTIPTCPKCGSRVFNIYAYGEAEAEYEYDDDGNGDWLPDTVGTGDHGDTSSAAICAECYADAEELLGRFGWTFYETHPKGEHAALIEALRHLATALSTAASYVARDTDTVTADAFEQRAGEARALLARIKGGSRNDEPHAVRTDPSEL